MNSIQIIAKFHLDCVGVLAVDGNVAVYMVYNKLNNGSLCWISYAVVEM